MIWAEVSFPSLGFIFRRGHYVVICFKREKWSLVCLVKRRIRSERISFHELIFIIETLLKGKRWSMKEFIWQSIRAIDVQLIHWCCKSIFWDFLQYRVNEKEIEWFCCIFDSLLYLYDSLSPSNMTALPFSKWGTPLQIWRFFLPNMPPPKLWQISSDMTCCADFKVVDFVTWYVSQQNTFSYFTVFAVKKLITHQSQIFVDLSASKELFCNICALPVFVSEKKKKRINSSYRTWCDWRCLTFSRTYSRKSKP